MSTKEDLPKLQNLINLCKDAEITPFDLYAYSLALEATSVIKELAEEDIIYTPAQALQVMGKYDNNLCTDIFKVASELVALMPAEPVKLNGWLSPAPTQCDVCQSAITTEFYDAATESLRGPWACMCHSCFTTGPGLNQLGLGIGQRYERQYNPVEDLWEWVCTGGGEQA